MTRFQTGRTYCTRSIGDADCIVAITIASRTEKTITTTTGKHGRGPGRVLRIRVYEGVERVAPWGRYSMSPIIAADDPEHLDPIPEPPRPKSSTIATDNAGLLPVELTPIGEQYVIPGCERDPDRGPAQRSLWEG